MFAPEIWEVFEEGLHVYSGGGRRGVNSELYDMPFTEVNFLVRLYMSTTKSVQGDLFRSCVLRLQYKKEVTRESEDTYHGLAFAC